MRLVMAIEPRSYRQAMGRAIQALRTRVEVVVIEPGKLEEAVARLDPHLVFADRPGGSAGGPAWVEFRPYEEPQARVRLDGRTWEVGEVDLPDLLSIVDRAEEEFARTGRGPGGN
jgi:hypothetical protein